jgi:hypothetical protein
LSLDGDRLAKEINDYLNSVSNEVPNMRSAEPRPRNPNDN